MRITFLFPASLRKVGWWLFIPALITLILLSIVNYEAGRTVWVPALANGEIFGQPKFFTMIENDITDEILFSMIIAGGVMAGFSRLRTEDEFTAQIRYESLVYATYVNFAVMLFATLTVYGTYYFNVLIANMLTLIVFFPGPVSIQIVQTGKNAGR